MLRHLPAAGWLALILTAVPAHARAHDASINLDAITILGTRTPQAHADLPRAIDTLDTRAITLEQGNDTGDLVDALPNISLDDGPRASGEDIRIRGLAGDRILFLVDGIREDLAKGHLSDYFIDPSLLRKVDVERGPASVLWGSGALGGVISVETKKAEDLLDPGEHLGGLVSGGYQSATDGWLGSAAVYGALDDNLEGMLYVGRRDNDDLELGNGHTLPHSAYRHDFLMAKGSWHPDAAQSFTLSHRHQTLDGHMPSNPADIISLENPLLGRTIQLNTTALNWQFSPQSRAVDLDSHVYHGRTEVDETAHSPGRHDHTQVDRIGLDLANTSRFGLGVGGAHELTYGMDGYRDRAEGTRNGGPRPEFPDAGRRLIGAFIQDVITWGDWTATLGLREDRYHSESRMHVAPDQTDHHLSKQFGLLWRTTDWLSLYANYAEAFRAPSLQELYATGTHFGANHFIANPGLKPETAANKEVGLRTHWRALFLPEDRLSFRLSAFQNDVDDYIDTVVNVQPLPYPPYVGGYTRSENVQDARLKGMEARLNYITPAWVVDLSYGRTRGDNRTTHEPLADIAPDRWVLQISYRDLPWHGRVTFRTTLAESQTRVPAGTRETPGYTTFDLLTSWHPRENLRLDVGVGNLTDKAYRRHNAVIDAAGRNVKANLTWHF